MFSFSSNSIHKNQLQITRRTWLGLGLGSMLHLPGGMLAASEPTKVAKPRSCILIWLGGGASHIDTFDPKPDADQGIKGEFKTIQSSIPGVALSEIMPNLAGVLDKTVLIRSLTSPEAEHDRASHHILTGWRPNPALVYPSAGSVYSKVHGAMAGVLPNHVAIPNKPVFGGSGYLTTACDPLDIPGDPGQPNFRVRDLTPPDKVTYERLLRRRGMVDALNRWSKSGQSSATAARETFDNQTYTLLTSQATLKAFAIDEEAATIRDRYGRNSLGQSLLLARRLVERGVGYVTINDRAGGLGWDTHAQNFPSLRDRLMPPLDQGVAALIHDLDCRGLLDDTLVVVCGEFGRTPKINANAGRDHHGRASSVLLAGGGLKRGHVLGRTDRNGIAPVDRPVTPAELASTIFSQLGIHPETRFQSPDGRPITLVDHASPIAEIIA
jgi:hypothetical protein